MIESLLFQLLLNGTLNEAVPDKFYVPPAIRDLTTQNQTLAPKKKKELIAPILSAQAVIAIDLDSKTVLFEKNADERRGVGSISKLVTALVALETAQPPDTIVTVSKEASSVEGRKVGLASGETITMHNLLLGMLIHSGNDAAFAIAEHIGGTVSLFMEKINSKIKSLGIHNTHFENPAGFDAKNHYSTARDVALFGIEALSNNFIRETANMKEAQITSSDSRFKHKLETTNELLSQDLFPVNGLKTGNTAEAGPSFIATTRISDRRIITVVLGSADRFGETKILLDWISRAYTW